MSIDVDKARRDTPACEKIIHFNNAGASLIPRPVLDSVIRHLRLEAEIGGYEAAEKMESKCEHTYDSIAQLIGAGRDEIAVLESATRAWDMAFYSLPLKKGDRILTSMAEYVSNYVAFLQLAPKTGVMIEVIPNDEAGQISIDALKHAIDERVKLIAITHVPTNGGLINPAADVGTIARSSGIPYLLDACQSAGQIPLQVDEIGCDMLSATGRKYLRAPRGTGFLYVRRNLYETLEPPFVDLHSAKWISRDRYEIRKDARRFENFESNIAAKIGLGVAIDYALSWGIEAIRDRISTLADHLREKLNSIRGVKVADLGKEKCGIVTFLAETKDPFEIRSEMRKQNINVWVSQIGSARLDMEARSLKALVRASVHYYNTDEEIVRFCNVLSSIV
ncbi:aminotransferase class V-fold PLP-dependent enzyme [bacterium]|nr:aminotransferase class V-fold PLP-dependent enzyme [bacterium]